MNLVRPLVRCVWCVVLMWALGDAALRGQEPDPALVSLVGDTLADAGEEGKGEGAAVESRPEADEPDEPPYLTWGNRKIFVGLDFAFVSYKDWAMDGSLGRERQILPSRLVLSAYGDLTDNVSYRAEVNPVARSITPRPYVPSPDDRRTYFFPNQPDMPGSRGVVSTPEGLFNVDRYKTLGLDPIHHLGGLRVGYVDLHTASRRVGVQVGRVYVPQGLGLERVSWFSAKDLTHMQQIDAAADNGALMYVDTRRLRLEMAVVTGNGAPFHDYGYFDFTAGEDTNSAVATMGRVTYRAGERLVVGASVKHNYVNSRIEDSITMSLSKRYDNAYTGFAQWRATRFLSVFGEVARYKWGLRDSSAELLAGPAIATPILKDGYYVGAEVSSPHVGATRLTATVVRSELGRDDSLVAWAAANGLFGVTLGKRERSNIVKLQGHVGRYVTLFAFWHGLSNPFPELSAIRPIEGPGSDRASSSNKSGMGLQLRF